MGICLFYGQEWKAGFGGAVQKCLELPETTLRLGLAGVPLGPSALHQGRLSMAKEQNAVQSLLFLGHPLVLPLWVLEIFLISQMTNGHLQAITAVAT